jgi:Zn-finger nucleic acid-binding protein
MEMRALGGCRRCGHVERIRGNPDAGVEVGTCPRCNGPLRSLGLLGAHLLAQERRREESFRRALGGLAETKSQRKEMA